jgi:HAD superfamily hydrolase (TIGR01509 family)
MSSSKPAAVVFDLGKVLLDFDYGPVVRHVAARSRVTLEAMHELLLVSPLLGEYERGELTSHTFHQRIVDATGYSEGYEAFAALFADIFAEIPPMVRLNAELRELGVPTYIFSNTNDLAIQHVRRNFPFFADFTGYVLSYEHGSMKPDAALYAVVERMTGRSGADLMYLDDRPENHAAGLARGWQAVLHEDPAVSRAQVVAAGLLDRR